MYVLNYKLYSYIISFIKNLIGYLILPGLFLDFSNIELIYDTKNQFDLNIDKLICIIETNIFNIFSKNDIYKDVDKSTA